MTTISRLSALTLCATLLASGGALAKAHDQSGTDVPGENAGAETAAPAQTLGSAKGKRPDDKTPDCPGKSCSANTAE